MADHLAQAPYCQHFRLRAIDYPVQRNETGDGVARCAWWGRAVAAGPDRPGLAEAVDLMLLDTFLLEGVVRVATAASRGRLFRARP